jgi:DNA-binding LytR/AlgR family response regulator
MKVLVVEDEIAAARRLIKMIKEVDPELEILSTTDSISSTVNWLNSNPLPELIFMDIHLADGSSFKIFDQVKITCPIIFTTAYDQYAIQAFKVNSIDYLLKPIKIDELAFSIKKYREVINQIKAIDIETLVNAIRKQEQTFQRRFIVQYADKLKAIEVEDIAYFTALEKGVFLVSLDNHRYAIDYTLEKLEGILDPMHFYRANRKFLVSFSSIKSMFTYSKSRVKLELTPNPETEVIVSSDRSAGFKEWLNQ